MQERRLTSPHSFLDANPLALPESVSVANPLDGHRNCLTRACRTSDLQITAGYWVGALSSTLPCSPSPGKKQPETRKPERNTSNRQKPQHPTRRATATSRQSRARQKTLESGPTSLPRGSWNVMPAATGKSELHQTPKEKTPQRRTRQGVLNLPVLVHCPHQDASACSRNTLDQFSG